MLANLKIICQFHTHSVHQNSVDIFWTEIYRVRIFFRADIYRGRFLTLILGSSSRLLHIRISADSAMYWFPVYHFRCMKFKPLVIWIWNQNIAISTIVGTSPHNMDYAQPTGKHRIYAYTCTCTNSSFGFFSSLFLIVVLCSSIRLTQLIKLQRRFFGRRYIGDDFFLGPRYIGENFF
jgi:hypothetical protein